MDKDRLDPGQRRTVEIIQALGFGVIECLSIRDGSPCFEPAPRIIQTIKLGCGPEQPPIPNRTDLTLNQEFEELLGHLGRIREGVVDIEIRHKLPFRLVVERRYTEFVSGENES